MGESAGFTFWNVGDVGMSGGSRRAALAIIAWTSWAAPSMSLSRLNCRVIWVVPTPLTDVMLSRPAIVENCFSRGVATAEAMVSGLAPGSEPLTRIVGKSTFGRSLTGSMRYAINPNKRIADMTRVVMTGLRMKGSAIFIVVNSNSPLAAFSLIDFGAL